ncbi:hypothetical protein PTTG_26369 [Puccinia triticina 1-1 BBBD Race 1]|uniref:Secreted protein n=2 Tax=Puccinia triticina TaxID=208348 RepID=A0A180GVQ7_PUCT1|nr:uncharacterized protein PtA15_3A100 [Puccinia triticina]OAV96372.1 hypothetical protein PTTG_26369 [Puccinia triticina 1-1 BBBD Race 1]WAQ82736.1 hypothetical protein PtA15_3A100 [Puccinia triticina]WAR53575.1 hypothetical protein PtB15_3B83 [Puccinia triticina]
MWLEKLLWGTFLASLVISAHSKPTEPQLHTLVRRQDKPAATAAPPKNGDAATEPVQCGDTFGSNNLKEQPGWVSCRDYNAVGFYCPVNKCHLGSSRDTPLTAPLNQFTFRNCESFSTHDHVIEATAVDSYMAHNRHGVSVVKGSAGKVYVCRWQDLNDYNNVRPWCDGCIYWDWTEPDWTPLLAQGD